MLPQAFSLRVACTNQWPNPAYTWLGRSGQGDQGLEVAQLTDRQLHANTHDCSRPSRRHLVAPSPEMNQAAALSLKLGRPTIPRAWQPSV